MTDQEILREAIDKASGNGYLDGYLENHEWYVHENGAKDGYILCMPDHKTKTKIHMADYSVIFSHDFAKAFWGTELVSDGEQSEPIAWEYHLQQMVLEKNPIRYLEKSL